MNRLIATLGPSCGLWTFKTSKARNKIRQFFKDAANCSIIQVKDLIPSDTLVANKFMDKKHMDKSYKNQAIRQKEACCALGLRDSCLPSLTA